MVAEDIFESLFRSHITVVYMLIIIPLSILMPPKAQAAGEFKIYRLQQFDLQTTPHGSRSHAISSEAKALGSKNVLRKCLVVRWSDVSVTKIHELIQKAVGAIVVLIPPDLDGLSEDHKELFKSFENQLLSESFAIPIFFAFETADLSLLLEELQSAAHAETGESAVEALVSAVSANGFQLVSASSSSKSLANLKLFNVMGKLNSVDDTDSPKTIAIVAHYDAFGAAPSLSFGADSNGSGVAALLELARLLARLYQNPRTRPRYNVVFLLSAGGKLNYQGTRQFIEDQLEQPESPLHNLQFAMCLDTVGSGDSLQFHVSKPPKPDTPSGQFLEQLVQAGNTRGKNVTMVHKKINLIEEFLGWEHERFSIRRLPAFTVSSLHRPSNFQRNTILDSRKTVSLAALTSNVQLIADSLLHYMFNLSHIENLELTKGLMEVQSSYLATWLDILTRQPRSPQLFLDAKTPLIVNLLQTLDHYTHEAQTLPVTADKKDPEFVLYEGAVDTMNIYKVKPAIFDLILALCIAAYLGLIYVFVVNYVTVQSCFHRILDGLKQKQV